MNKKRKLNSFLMLALLLFSTSNVNAEMDQNHISLQEVKAVFNALSLKHWDATRIMAAELMHRNALGQTHLIQRMRYIYLYAITSMLNNEHISTKQAHAFINELVGTRLITPWHPIKKKNSPICFNEICQSKKDQQTLFTRQTSDDGNTILTYEYVEMRSEFDTDSFAGEIARLNGRVEKIEFSSDNDKPWIASIFMDDGMIELDL
ncbi:MAG: hypothetical protein OEY38_03115 [Gammaproteobacteria bacterium]|nr:hypothetical protein [Gammaproteobacteria bacterium]